MRPRNVPMRMQPKVLSIAGISSNARRDRTVTTAVLSDTKAASAVGSRMLGFMTRVSWDSDVS